MPEMMERALKRAAGRLARKHRLHRKKGETMKGAKNAYTYGTLRKIEMQHRAKGGAPGKYLKKV